MQSCDECLDKCCYKYEGNYYQQQVFKTVKNEGRKRFTLFPFFTEKGALFCFPRKGIKWSQQLFRYLETHHDSERVRIYCRWELDKPMRKSVECNLIQYVLPVNMGPSTHDAQE